MVEKLPLTVESMNKMIDTKLSQEAILDFAKDMLAVRFPEEELNRITIDMDDFVTPVRDEDKGNDLWRVFNVVQEKITQGGFSAALIGAKVRKVRKIKSFEKDLKINQDLFKLATALV